MKKLELVQSFCCKLHEATQVFVVVDYVREMILKKSCKFGDCGSFEHLLFLFVSFHCILVAAVTANFGLFMKLMSCNTSF